MKTKTPKAQPKTAKASGSSNLPGGKNRKTRFVLHDSTAQEVFLAGDFNDWDPDALPLKPDGNGGWSAEIEKFVG